ncbi:hypothetical protein ACOMHN_013241 [Nucella lapillus]
MFTGWDVVDDDDKDKLYDPREIFSESSSRDIFAGISGRDVHSQPSEEEEPFTDIDEEAEEEAGQNTKNHYKCSFSGSAGKVVTVEHKEEVKPNDDDEDSDRDVEGSGHAENNPSEGLITQRQFELLSNTTSAARMAFLSGSGEGSDREDADEAETRVTTVILPLTIPKATATSLLHVTVAGDGKLISWDSMTTALNGVTDDIIYSGASPACPYDDEEDCTEVSSGTDDDIFKPTVIVKTTPAPPTTTTREKPKTKIIPNGADCQGDQCSKPGVISQQTDLSFSTPDPLPNDRGTIKPTIDTGKTRSSDGSGGGGINIGLIVGIAVSVLVAVVILCVALYKFRRRDEGTYKVDESQNFSTLDGRKAHQGNGTLLSHSGETGAKRGGKKKGVKEWYV